MTAIAIDLQLPYNRLAPTDFFVLYLHNGLRTTDFAQKTLHAFRRQPNFIASFSTQFAHNWPYRLRISQCPAVGVYFFVAIEQLSATWRC